LLLAELLRRGWSEQEVVNAAGGNFLRVLTEAERVAARLRRKRPASDARLPPPVAN
jgi:membrane dipeptidase